MNGGKNVRNQFLESYHFHKFKRLVTQYKKKGKYIYYHCTEYHGACNKKWIREEELTKQFAQCFEKIHIPEEIVESISKMLCESHQGKADYNKQLCQSLQEEYDKLGRRIERMYEDFLDRNIEEDFFKLKREDYRREQKNIRKRLDNLEGADGGYYITACYLLQLANKAPAIFESSEVETKRQLIKLVLQNPVINDVSLSATIRKPFSYFVEGSDQHIWGRLYDMFRNRIPIDDIEISTVKTLLEAVGV